MLVFDAVRPSTASPLAGSRCSVTEFTTKGTFDGLVARKSSTTREASPPRGSTRTLRILPSSRRCAPLVAVNIVNTNPPTTASPNARKIQKPLLIVSTPRSIAQQAAVRLQRRDMIAQRFERRRQRDG